MVTYAIGDTVIMETPGLVEKRILTRTISIAERTRPLILVVAELPGGTAAMADGIATLAGQANETKRVPRRPNEVVKRDQRIAAGVAKAPGGVTLSVSGSRILLNIAAGKAVLFTLAVWSPSAEPSAADEPMAMLARVPDAVDPATYGKGGPARWKTPITVAGALGCSDDPYAVDTLTAPDKNPWRTRIFWSGFDFFADGKRAAISTLAGDVWVVSGIDASLAALTWKRFASGLHQPLGVRIVDEVVHVHGRDQITRLRDIDGDGEADAYENFFNGIMVTPNWHEFACDLHTDAEGNFYFVKGGPVKGGGRGFERITKHHGCLFKLSRDGAKLEVIATGFRLANGIGVGPKGEITSGENEGTWTPACRINLIKPGGFYGCVDLAHRAAPPTDFDQPMCWLPMSVSNSDGSQVWVTSDKWGPFTGQLLHTLYGKCSLFHAMREVVDGKDQAAVTRFPCAFDSGVMRGRFNPVDGQLYVCGLKGWQTNAAKDACFHRIRYTGKPVNMAKAVAVRSNGIVITFTDAIDAAGVDTAAITMQAWSYSWSKSYGSQEYGASTKKKNQRDFWTITAAKLSSDRKTLSLTVPDLKPCMQYQIKAKLGFGGAAPVVQEVTGTIHALGKTPL